MNRLISLSVETTGAEDYVKTFDDMSELGRFLGQTHKSVSMSVTDTATSDATNVKNLYYPGLLS